MTITKTRPCSIQIFFKLYKLKIFSGRFFLHFSYVCSTYRLWVHVRTASPRMYMTCLLSVLVIYTVRQNSITLYFFLRRFSYENIFNQYLICKGRQLPFVPDLFGISECHLTLSLFLLGTVPIYSYFGGFLMKLVKLIPIYRTECS